MRERLYACLVALGVCVPAFAESLPLFDFETEAERKAVRIHQKGGVFGACREHPCSGAWSLAYCPDAWRKGLAEWPSITLNVPEALRDWTGFDRLSIDIVSLGDGFEQFKCFVAGPDGNIQQGYREEPITLPARGWKRWEISLSKIATKVDLGNVARIHFFTTRPLKAKVYVDNIQLLRHTETLSLPDTPAWKELMAENERRTQAENEAARRKRDEMIAGMRREAAGAGRSADDFLLASATPMEKIRPRQSGKFRPAKTLSVRLAKNEFEAVQLLVLPAGKPLRRVSVAVGELVGEAGALPPSCVSAHPVGYVKTRFEPPYSVYPGPSFAEVGWWPDPILSYTNAVDVAADDWQSFWISVKCPSGQPAGTYRGSVTVSAEGARPVVVPLSVRVNDFALPPEPAMPIAVTFNPGCRPHTVGKELAARITADPASPMNAWKRHRGEWTDFLADHLIPLFNLYCNGSAFHRELDFAELERLHAQKRLGHINLGYWNYPRSLEEKDLAKWRKETLPRLRAVWEEVRARGWERHACLYGCDEVSPDKFPLIRHAVEALHREFPGVPLFTTAYDHDYGRPGTPLEGIDWFTPVTDKFDGEKAARARAEGKRVWWYIALNPVAPFANIFVEATGIETRLLMGAMAQKYRPDGFLYYQCAIWENERCIAGGPYTDWNPLSFKRYHGDGSWTCAGPDGTPIATIRLENFRDGLEDLAYARLLEKRTGEKVDVPPDLVRSLTDFTLDPQTLYDWRDRLADRLEATQQR